MHILFIKASVYHPDWQFRGEGGWVVEKQIIGKKTLRLAYVREGRALGLNEAALKADCHWDRASFMTA